MHDRFSHWAHVARQLQQHGQGMVEYALLLVFIAVVAVATVTALGASVYSLYSRASFSF